MCSCRNFITAIFNSATLSRYSEDTVLSAGPLFTDGLTAALNMLMIGGLGEAVASIAVDAAVTLPKIEGAEEVFDAVPLVDSGSGELFASFFKSKENNLAGGGVHFASSSLPVVASGFKVVLAPVNGAAGTLDRNAKGDAAPAVADGAGLPNPSKMIDKIHLDILTIIILFVVPEKPLNTLLLGLSVAASSASDPPTPAFRLVAFLITRVFSSSGVAVLNVPRSSGSSS